MPAGNKLNTVDDTGLTADQLKAAVLMAEGANYQQAADAVNVSYQTIRNWMVKPEFKAEFDRRAKESAELMVRQIQVARMRMIGMEEKGATAIDRALDAKKKDGTDDHPTQLRAAEIMFRVMGLGAPKDYIDLGKGGAKAQAAVIIVTPEEMKLAQRLKLLKGDEEVIDAEVIDE